MTELRRRSRLRRWIGAAVMMMALSTTFVAVPVAPAEAHSSGHSSCITNWKEGWWNIKLKARNDCGHAINMKFQITFGRDGSCRHVAAGSTITWNVGWGSARGKAVPC